MPPGLPQALVALWPWLIVAYLAWFAASWPIGFLLGDLMLRLTPVVTVATPVVLALILAAVLAHDDRRHTGLRQVVEDEGRDREAEVAAAPSPSSTGSSRSP